MHRPRGQLLVRRPHDDEDPGSQDRLADDKLDTLTEPGFVRAVAFLTDGRPVWSVVAMETKEKPAMSQLKVLNQKGDVTTALTVEGVVDQHCGSIPAIAGSLSPALQVRVPHGRDFSAA